MDSLSLGLPLVWQAQAFLLHSGAGLRCGSIFCDYTAMLLSYTVVFTCFYLFVRLLFFFLDALLPSLLLSSLTGDSAIGQHCPSVGFPFGVSHSHEMLLSAYKSVSQWVTL